MRAGKAFEALEDYKDSQTMVKECHYQQAQALLSEGKYDDAIELFGGFCSVIYTILIPGLIYIKNDNVPKSKLIKYVTVFAITILVIIGYTAGVLTILFNMVKINGEVKS